MRPYQQRQILETVQTLNEVVTELGKQSDPNVVSGLISECSEFTNVVKNHIDGLTGKETLTSKLLTEYVELLDKYISGEVTKGKLHNQVVRIERSVKTELKPDKIEIAFLPYNASMWDSLESVWLEVKDDPSCDAYVVPIPYYELAPNGDLVKMHYEGGKYPENVPITNWQEYDIEARRPGVVFIHYAYDDAGRNASIHPDFYSRRLREHCDLLLYIPYFVYAGAYMEDYYTTLPGVLYADRVILQSEEQRQSYIDQYKHYDKLNGWDGRYGNPAKKFVALGSPKFDKALDSKRDDYYIPEAWEELLYRKDGTRKKVIFYNTHMFKWINGGEPYFKKLQSVFEFFRSRDDVVLWWRPHPNTELNFRRFCPELFDRYMRVVQEYKKAGWGIYDDTSDLHRAIAWSDAYYGDGSSVTELFKVTGKAIYFQNFDPTGEEPIELLGKFWFHATDIFETCGEFYAVTFSQYLFKLIDKNFKYESEIAISPNLPRHRNYITQIAVGDKVTFIPHNDNQIAVYDIKSKEYSIYPLELKDEYLAPLNDANRNFFDGIIYKNKMFLVPCGYRNMVAFHLDTKETEHCLDLLQLFPKEKMHSLSYGWTWLNENTILLASLYTNEVLEFSLDTYGHKLHKLGRNKQSFHNIFKYDNNFFLIGRQPFMLKWNYETGEVVTYDKLPNNFKIKQKQDWVFFANNIKPYKNKLILFGGYTNMVLEFDLDTCEFRKLDVFDKILNRKLKAESNDAHSFSTCNFMLDNFIYFVHKNEVLFRYDFETQTIEDVCDLVPTFTADAWNVLNNSFVDSMLKSENLQVKIGDNDKLQDGQSGKRIYDYIKTRWLKL